MNTLGQRTVAAAILSAIFSTSAIGVEPLVWAGCGISKKAYVTDLAKAFSANSGIPIKLEGGGAAKGIRSVASLSKDIGGSCRPKLFRAGEEHATKLAPVGWDALVAITHPENPVDSINTDQLRGVFSGQIRNWKQLGGNDAPILTFTRRGKISGVGSSFRTMVFDDPDYNFVAGKEFKSSGPLEKAIQKDVNAIGVTGISSARKRDVKILAINGKLPTYQNVQSGRYLLYRPLYLAYNPAHPRLAEIKQFIEFAYTDEGQQIMRRNGTVPYLEATNLFAQSLAERLSISRTGGL